MGLMIFPMFGQKIVVMWIIYIYIYIYREREREREKEREREREREAYTIQNIFECEFKMERTTHFQENNCYDILSPPNLIQMTKFGGY